MQTKSMGLLFVLTSVLLVDVGQLFLKYGMNQVGGLDFSQGFLSLFFSVFSNPFVFIGVVLFASSSLGWLLALSKVPLSYAYPIVSVGYVLVTFFSWLLFHEAVSGMRILGLSIIVGGVFFLSRT
jgi:multidrug transporter EmrE-like cation transporter